MSALNRINLQVESLMSAYGPVCTGNYFRAKKIPSISFLNYLVRLQKFMHCSDECFVVALIYIKRLKESEPQLDMSPFTVHRIFLAAVVTATKFLDDQFYLNSYYAKVGGVSVLELKNLELSFLSILDYNLNVSQEEYHTEFSALFKESFLNSTKSCYVQPANQLEFSSTVSNA